MTKPEHAIKAAQLYSTKGPYVARSYAIKHKVLPLYRLARQLSAAQKAGL